MKKKYLVFLFLILMALPLAGCKFQTKGEIVNIVGSSALQPLVESAGEAYTKTNPNTYINVQGGGSGTGLAQIQSGAVDVGNSDLFAEEKSGINAHKLVDHQMAVVGIVPVINKDIPVKNLTMSQLRDIFLGKITNWQEVGGPNLDIVLLNRAQGSGTRVTFEKTVLQGKQPVDAQEQDSSGMVRKIIASTPGSISYLAFSYLDSSVKTIKVDGVSATQKNVTTNAWKIWSYEHMYTQKKTSASVKKFMNFVMSSEVQNKIVNKMGYIAIKDMHVKQSIDGHVTAIK